MFLAAASFFVVFENFDERSNSLFISKPSSNAFAARLISSVLPAFSMVWRCTVALSPERLTPLAFMLAMISASFLILAAFAFSTSASSSAFFAFYAAFFAFIAFFAAASSSAFFAFFAAFFAFFAAASSAVTAVFFRVLPEIKQLI